MSGEPTVLFVDDEASIRLTLPLLLESHGFKVTAAANVAEALKLITERQFDVLISDMNIDRPGDGFTVASAMRSTQPNALRFILTGYPDIESALQALRLEVDDYLIKPAETDHLVGLMRAKLEKRTRRQEVKSKPLSEIIERERESISQKWLELVKQDPELNSVPLGDSERRDHVPRLLTVAVAALQGKVVNAKEKQASAEHGETRQKQGYAPEWLVREAKLLQYAIATCVQRHLLEIQMSTFIPDLVRVFGLVQGLLEESLAAFLHLEYPPKPRRSSPKKYR